MRIPFLQISSGKQSPPVLLAALGLVALVPAVGVLWFMSVAMRNERLAVQERLTAVYANHLASLPSHVTAFGRARQAALQASAGGTPAETFAALVRAKLADAVIVTDAAGKVLYPSSAPLGAGVRGDEGPEWARARELEFQRRDFVGAADAYGRIAGSSLAANARARAMQAQAVCWLKADEPERALARLAELADDASLRQAVSAQGRLIGPEVQLLILKTLGRKPGLSEAGYKASRESGVAGVVDPGTLGPRVLADLVARLNDYSAAEMPANQRRFLMSEVSALATESPASRLLQDTTFPTLAAENLAADYLDTDPLVAGVADPGVSAVAPATTGPASARPATTQALQRTSLPNVWRLAGAGGTIIALFREERLRAALAKQLDTHALPDVRVHVLAPGDATTALKLPVPPQDAGEFLPGWRLALSFRNGDPLGELSARQARFYLGMGVGVVAIIGVLAVMVARYVNAQMRLARVKDELVSAVSHELKTPLASMRVLLDTLSAGRCRDEAHMQRYLQLATKENLRLSRLIENFLVFSRLERGQQQFHFAAVSPHEIVRTALEALREKLGGPGCQVSTQVAADLPPIRGDADALATVLVNLIDNAYKYTNGEKRIRVRVDAESHHGAPSAQHASADWPQEAQKAQKQSGSVLSFMSFGWPSPALTSGVSTVVFEVADNGIGIAPAEQQRIFDRFYQVDQTLTRQRDGCGLGLSIVHSIVSAHGGDVTVESEPGKGSTFRVKLPIVPTPSSQGAQSSEGEHRTKPATP